jgi:hypothetical protein
VTRTDEITLTFPADRDFYRVAHLVLGGLAVRLNLTFESLEDLQLALDGVLDSQPGEADVTVAVSVRPGVLETLVGPFPNDRIRTELARAADDDMSLRRVLDAVVDGVELEDRDGGQWVRLTKHVAEIAELGAGA